MSRDTLKKLRADMKAALARIEEQFASVMASIRSASDVVRELTSRVELLEDEREKRIVASIVTPLRQEPTQPTSVNDLLEWAVLQVYAASNRFVPSDGSMGQVIMSAERLLAQCGQDEERFRNAVAFLEVPESMLNGVMEATVRKALAQGDVVRQAFASREAVASAQEPLPYPVGHGAGGHGPGAGPAAYNSPASLVAMPGGPATNYPTAMEASEWPDGVNPVHVMLLGQQEPSVVSVIQSGQADIHLGRLMSLELHHPKVPRGRKAVFDALNARRERLERGG